MKHTRLLAGAAVSVLVLAACGSDSGSSSGSAASTPTEIGKGEGALKIVAWAGYAEDGSTDPAYNWVGPFEEETGCKTDVKIGNTSDEMFQLMSTGEYDGVSASGDSSVRLIDAGQVAPVNVDLISNYKDLSPFLKDQTYNTKDGSALRRPPRLGRQPPHVEHRRRDAGARLVGRGLRPRLALQGQGHGLRQRRSTSPTPGCT